jgi:hypothetical protein
LAFVVGGRQLAVSNWQLVISNGRWVLLQWTMGIESGMIFKYSISIFMFANCQLPIANSIFIFADCQLPTANSFLPTANC